MIWPTRDGRPFLRRCAVTVAAIAVGACCAAPQAAFATYAEVTDSYPATQDVTPAGDAIPASKIPAGTYSITASTSSYMCRMTDCTLTVKDGKMAVTFTMSKAYTRIYLGTAEEAAKHTNADGTDDSAYYRGTPPDGYVAHVYTLPVSELNDKMTIATYAGGTKTCKWFTRTVCFNASAEVNEAVATGKAPEQKKDGGGSGGNGGNSDAGKGSGGGTVTPGPGNASGSKEAGAGSKGGSGSKKSAAAGGSTAAGGTSGSGAGTAAGSGSGVGSAGSAAGGSAGSSAAGSSAKGASGSEEKAAKRKDADVADKGGSDDSGPKAKSGPHVVGITPAQAATLTGAELPMAEDSDEDAADDNTAFCVALGVLAAAIAALAVVLGVTLRRVRKLRPGKRG